MNNFTRNKSPFKIPFYYLRAEKYSPKSYVVNFRTQMSSSQSEGRTTVFTLEKKMIRPIRSKRVGEQGWQSGESTRLPPMWPGFKSRRPRHMWVEFVVGSLPCSEGFFSGYSGFPLSSKTNISRFQFDQESGGRRTTMWMCYLQIVILLFNK